LYITSVFLGYILAFMRLMTVWMITGKIIRTAISLTYAAL